MNQQDEQKWYREDDNGNLVISDGSGTNLVIQNRRERDGGVEPLTVYVNTPRSHLAPDFSKIQRHPKDPTYFHAGNIAGVIIHEYERTPGGGTIERPKIPRPPLPPPPPPLGDGAFFNIAVYGGDD